MSINNVWIEPDRALVGVDSEGRDDQGRIHQVSKMLPLPHQNSVLSGTGTIPFLNTVWSVCHAAAGDFDRLLKALPELVPFAYKFMLGAAAQYKAPLGPTPEKQSCIACGWSPSRERMVAVGYSQADEAAGFVMTEIPDGAYVQPGIDDRWRDRLANLPAPNTPEAMGRYAQEQASIVREFVPEIHAGGRFIVATITRNSMTIAPVCGLS